MADDNFAFGLYSATISEVLLCSETAKDKESGQEVEREYLSYEVALVEHVTKTGEVTPLEHRPIVKFRKYLVGGCLTGLAGEITTKQLQATAGELLAECGMDIFLPPNNATLVGRPIQVMCSANDRNAKYRNWEVFSPGQAAPKVAATKKATSVLNNLLGLKPTKKAAPKAAAPAPTAGTASAIDYGEDVPF